MTSDRVADAQVPQLVVRCAIAVVVRLDDGSRDSAIPVEQVRTGVLGPGRALGQLQKGGSPVPCARFAALRAGKQAP